MKHFKGGSIYKGFGTSALPSSSMALQPKTGPGRLYLVPPLHSIFR